MAKTKPPVEENEVLLEIPDEPPWAEPPLFTPQVSKSSPFGDKPTTTGGVKEPEPTPVVPSLSMKNQDKLARAKELLEKMFTLAAGGLIENGKFYGHTSIDIAWTDGVAQDILPTVSARDRVGN